jgi:hypothetical protein
VFVEDIQYAINTDSGECVYVVVNRYCLSKSDNESVIEDICLSEADDIETTLPALSFFVLQTNAGYDDIPSGEYKYVRIRFSMDANRRIHHDTDDGGIVIPLMGDFSQEEVECPEWVKQAFKEYID